MKGHYRMIGRHKRMDGMPQFMGQGRHIAWLSRIISQHPRRHTRQNAGTKGPTAFTRPDFSINMPFIEDAPGVIGHNGRELLQAIQDHGDRIAIGNLFGGCLLKRRI